MSDLMANVGAKWIDVLPKANNIAWGSDSDTLGTQLNFDSFTYLKEGTVLRFKIDTKLVFMGIVVSRTKNKQIFSYTCFDFAFYLNKNEAVIQFNKIAADVAIKQLGTMFGIKINCAKMSTLISKIYKDMTLSAIIEDILEIVKLETGIKYIKEMISDILYVRKQSEYKIYPKFILSEDLPITFSIEEMKNRVLVVGNDEDNNKILATAIDTNNIKLYGGLQEVLTVDAKDIAKAKNIANNYLKANNKVFKSATLNIIVISGGDEIKANRSIGFYDNLKDLKGWYNIKSTSNTLENGIMKSSITLEW